MPIGVSSNIPRCSPELKRLLARAKLINRYYEKEFDISFSSMLLAFLVSNDIISRWFSDYVKRAGIDVGRILEERKVSQQILQDIASRVVLQDQLPDFLSPDHFNYYVPGNSRQIPGEPCSGRQNVSVASPSFDGSIHIRPVGA